MNAKRGFGNVIMNILSQIVTLVLGIVIPRLILVNLGSEANGLLTSVSQVLVYVALLEAGIGTASLQALYGPVAKDDKTAISEILSATNHFYRRTGKIYFAVVLLLTFIFPFTIHSELPRATIMWVMFLSGAPGVVNYYVQGKYRILLQAEGKEYIYTALFTVIHIFTSLSKIVLLLRGYDVVALQLMYLIFDLIQVVCIVIYIKRHYKWLDLHVKPNYSAISQSKNVLTHQVSGLIFNHTDALVLTYFCGLKTVSVYSMYSMLFSMVDTVIGNFFGVNFILGQTFHTDQKKYLQMHDVYELYIMTLSFSLFCIAVIFILPFMVLYTGDVSDIDYIDQLLPILFVATYLLSKGRTASMQVINFAQHFKQTQWHAIVESAINIGVSLLAVYKFGIYGVLVGTIAALLFRTNAMIIYANKHILHRSSWITYRRWLLNLALFIGITLLSKAVFAHIALDSYFSIIAWAAVCCVVIIPFFFVTVSLFDRETYRFAKELLTPYAKSALAKLKRS